MRTKQVTVQMKADGESLTEGQFTGYAAVFDNIDSYGDVIRKGAFLESLAGYGVKGSGIPCYWSHQMSNPMMNIGQTVEAHEDERGLFVKVQLDLDTEMGAQVHRLIKAGRVNQMSFAFDIQEHAFVRDESGDFLELRKLKLHEVSVVQVGANQETELLDVKDRLTRAKAGRALSAKDEDQLRQAASLVDGVLAALETTEKVLEAGQGHEAPTNSGDAPETPESTPVPGEQVKTGGHPDLALATITTLYNEGE